ncbi:MAG: hypothetical protein Q8R78_03295 [Candidatus Omnitrophota bacterium]|nr:hypothetical protein [Candidatus Omnitrophota bacterium]
MWHSPSHAGHTVNPFTGKLDRCITVEETDGSPSNKTCGTILTTDGTLTDNANGTYTFTGTGAPIGATYLTQTAHADLTNEQAIGALASGILRGATTTGVITVLTTSAGISDNISDEQGSGALVFATSPSLTTPTLGAAAATSLSLTDALTVGNGGTGATSLTDGGILLGSGTGAITPMGVLADGSIVIGDGTTDPTTLAAFSSSTGTLNVASGGTGAASLTDGGLLLGSGTGAVTASAVLTEGQLLIGDGTTDPAIAAMSGDATMASSGALTIAANAVALTTDTTGNYVASVADGSGIDVTGTAGEGWTATVNLLYTDTLAADPTMNAEETRFTTDGTGGGLIFEGSTADTVEGLLVWAPTADRTLTLPDATDTLVGKATTDTLTNKTLSAADNVIAADTAVALAANGVNCTVSGEFPKGVDAGGAVETCTAAAGGAINVINELISSCSSTGSITSCSTITATTGANPVIMGFSGPCDKAVAEYGFANFEVDNTAQMGTSGPSFAVAAGETICSLTHLTDDLTAAEHTFEITVDSNDTNIAKYACGAGTGCSFWISEQFD